MNKLKVGGRVRIRNNSPYWRQQYEDEDMLKKDKGFGVIKKITCMSLPYTVEWTKSDYENSYNETDLMSCLPFYLWGIWDVKAGTIYEIPDDNDDEYLKKHTEAGLAVYRTRSIARKVSQILKRNGLKKQTKIICFAAEPRPSRIVRYDEKGEEIK